MPNICPMYNRQHTMPTMKQSRTFPAEPSQLRPLCRFVVIGAEIAGFNAKEQMHIELACDEAATNIVEHAYGGRGGAINVTWEANTDAFRVTLEDNGQAFQPDKLPPVEPPTASTPVEAVRAGGLGVHLMRQLMDDVIFEFEDDGNRVVLVKHMTTEQHKPVRHTTENGIDVVHVAGRLDPETIPDLEAALQAILAQGAYAILLDLSKTTYTNSGGLRVIVAAWREARQNGGDVVLVGLNDDLRDIFEMVGFDKILTIVESADQARDHLIS